MNESLEDFGIRLTSEEIRAPVGRLTGMLTEAFKQQIRALQVGDRVADMAGRRGSVTEAPPSDVDASEACWYWFGVLYDGDKEDRPTRGWALRPLSVVDRIAELSE